MHSKNKLTKFTFTPHPSPDSSPPFKGKPSWWNSLCLLPLHPHPAFSPQLPALWLLLLSTYWNCSLLGHSWVTFLWLHSMDTFHIGQSLSWALHSIWHRTPWNVSFLPMFLIFLPSISIVNDSPLAYPLILMFPWVLLKVVSSFLVQNILPETSNPFSWLHANDSQIDNSC